MAECGGELAGEPVPLDYIRCCRIRDRILEGAAGQDAIAKDIFGRVKGLFFVCSFYKQIELNG